jgi:hypothetical protein
MDLQHSDGNASKPTRGRLAGVTRGERGLRYTMPIWLLCLAIAAGLTLAPAASSAVPTWACLVSRGPDIANAMRG